MGAALTVIGLLVCLFLLYARGISKVVEAPFWTVVRDLLRAIRRREFF